MEAGLLASLQSSRVAATAAAAGSLAEEDVERPARVLEDTARVPGAADRAPEGRKREGGPAAHPLISVGSFRRALREERRYVRELHARVVVAACQLVVVGAGQGAQRLLRQR
jgi:hypothetical protein